MRKKPLISLLLIILTAVLMFTSISILKKTSDDNYIHASDLQDDASNMGKECCVVLKAPFYAGRAMYLTGSYPYEYSYYPAYDCSPEKPGIVYLCYNVDDDASIDYIQSACDRLKKMSYETDGKDAADAGSVVLTGVLSESQFAIPDEAQFIEAVKNYVPSMLSEPGAGKVIPENTSYELHPLVFTVCDIEAPTKPPASKAVPIILVIIASLSFIACVAVTISDLRDRR